VSTSWASWTTGLTAPSDMLWWWLCLGEGLAACGGGALSAQRAAQESDRRQEGAVSPRMETFGCWSSCSSRVRVNGLGDDCVLQRTMRVELQAVGKWELSNRCCSTNASVAERGVVTGQWMHDGRWAVLMSSHSTMLGDAHEAQSAGPAKIHPMPRL
jgi:hypothetical protein